MPICYRPGSQALCGPAPTDPISANSAVRIPVRHTVAALVAVLIAMFILPVSQASAQASSPARTATISSLLRLQLGDPSPPALTAPRTPVYTVRKNDGLSAIAARLGHPAQWQWLWWANRNKIKNPNSIRTGWKLAEPAWRTVPAWLMRRALAAMGPTPVAATAAGSYAPALSVAPAPVLRCRH